MTNTAVSIITSLVRRVGTSHSEAELRQSGTESIHMPAPRTDTGRTWLFSLPIECCVSV